MTLWSVLMIVFPGLAIVVAIIWAMKDKDIRDDGYDKKRGLGAGYYSALEDGRTHRGGRIVHRRGGSGGSGCACACACACAGGGRAGCSRKDFYGTKLYTKAIYTALEKESE